MFFWMLPLALGTLIFKGFDLHYTVYDSLVMFAFLVYSGFEIRTTMKELGTSAS